jgi:2-dehydropantoate 2-reductase
VRHGFGKRLIVGEPGGSAARARRRWPQLLQRAGFDAELSTTIQQDIWFKLWGNMTMNPISALTGADTDRILDDELVRGFCANVMREARDIGERLGIPIDQQPEDRHAVTRKLGAFKTSMLQDVEAVVASRSPPPSPSIDALVGAVRELGHVPEPACASAPRATTAHPLDRRAAGAAWPAARGRVRRWWGCTEVSSIDLIREDRDSR